MDVDLQTRRELREFVFPVRKQSKRSDDKSGAVAFGVREEQPRDGLDGLAEAHIVSKKRAETVIGEKIYPRHSARLVIAQFPGQPFYPPRRLEHVFSGRLQSGHKTSQPSAGSGRVYAQPSGKSYSAREGESLVKRNSSAVLFFEGFKSLFENVPVDFDPTVSEKDERGILLEKKTDFLRIDLLRVDHDGQTLRA